jgi:hypothetical protein
MGLMDKVKTQATVLAQKTQDTAREVQARRRADAMLRELGTAVYAERTGRSTAGTDSKIDKLVADLAAYETEHGVNLTAAPSGATQADGSAGSDAEDEGTSDPGTGDPGTSDPGTGDPGTANPGTEDPGTTQV